MLLHMVNGMVADMQANKEVDKVADIVAGQGHGGWLIWPKLFRPEPYPPICMSSKLCEFILILHLKSKD